MRAPESFESLSRGSGTYAFSYRSSISEWAVSIDHCYRTGTFGTGGFGVACDGTSSGETATRSYVIATRASLTSFPTDKLSPIDTS